MTAPRLAAPPAASEPVCPRCERLEAALRVLEPDARKLAEKAADMEASGEMGQPYLARWAHAIRQARAVVAALDGEQ